MQSAPFSHLYEQLPPLHVVSHVPPAHVQSFPEHVSCWFEELQAAIKSATKKSVRIMNDSVGHRVSRGYEIRRRLQIFSVRTTRLIRGRRPR